MPRDIIGTEGFSGGALQVPTGDDNGNSFSRTVTEFMARMAVHTHSNVSSKAATLPPKLEQTFLGISFSSNGAGLYTATLSPLDVIKVTKNNLEFYYKLTSESDTVPNWKRFYPTYTVSVGANDYTTVKTNRNDIDIKVVA